MGVGDRVSEAKAMTPIDVGTVYWVAGVAVAALIEYRLPKYDLSFLGLLAVILLWPFVLLVLALAMAMGIIKP